MDGMLTQTESREEAVTSVQSNLLFEFRNKIPHDVIAAAARQSVEEIHRQPIKITTFVPLLALRRARDRLRVAPNPSAFGQKTAS